MKNKCLSIILLFVSLNLLATTYTKDEIHDAVVTNELQDSSREFVRQFFTAKNPQQFIVNYSNSKGNALVKEYHIFALLNHIAHIPKQDYLQDFVTAMKSHPVESFKLHEEGRLEMPVYNLNTRAMGIENIWLAAESQNFYTKAFIDDPIATLNDLNGRVNMLEAPRWLGLKNSISTISAENHIKIIDYFVQNKQNLIGLDKFVSHYALLTANKVLVNMALLNLNKSNSEYTLRQLINYFEADFVVQQLISSVNNNKNQAFAISMMTPFVDKNAEITDFLLNNIANKSLATSCAFALSQSNNVHTLNKLSSIYSNSQSTFIKNQINHSLKMNNNSQAKIVINTLKGELK